MKFTRWRTILPLVTLFCTVLSLNTTPAAADETTPTELPSAETVSPVEPTVSPIDDFDPNPPGPTISDEEYAPELADTAASSTAGDGLPSISVMNSIYLPQLSNQSASVQLAAIEAETFTITPPFSRVGSYIIYNSETLDPASAGLARYTLNVERSGTYVLKMLVDAPTTSSNSMFVGIGSSTLTTAQLWSITPTSGFQSRAVIYPNQTSNHVFNLSAGSHTLTIAGRERGLKIDSVWLEAVSVESSSTKLGAKYGPPTLTNPKTITISNANPNYWGNGTEDVIVRIAEKMTKSVKVANVRNVVLIGGEFTITPALTSSLSNTADMIRRHRALAFSDIRGTLYIEGIHVNNSGGGLTEVLQVWNTPGSVIIRNSRFEGPRTKPGDTTFSFNHPDLLQVMSGKVVLENVTLTDSDFQGMFFGQETNQSLTSITFRNVNTSRVSRQAWSFSGLGTGVVKGCENCWHNTVGSRWPDNPVYSFLPKPTQVGSAVVWNNHSSIAQGTTVRIGTPPNGDFVPASKVGLTYDRSYFQ